MFSVTWLRDNNDVADDDDNNDNNNDDDVYTEKHVNFIASI